MIGTWLHFGMVLLRCFATKWLSRSRLLLDGVRVFLDYYHHILRLLICGSLAYDDDAALLHAVVQNVLLNFL